MASSSEEKLPDDKTVKKAEKLKTKGNQHLKNGEYDAAIESYSSAIKLDSKNPAYYSNRAAVHLKTGDNNSAIADCRKALDLNPHHSKTLCRLGVAFMNVERRKEAKECFEAAVRIQPGNQTYKHNLSLCEECWEKNPVKDAESESVASVAEPRLTSDRSSADEFHSPELVTTDFPSFVQPHLENASNAGAPDLGALMNDPMFLRITQSILSSETIVNAIRQQAEEVRNMSGTDAHDHLGNTGDGLEDEPDDFFGPLRTLQTMVDRQRDANAGRPSHGGGGKAPPPPPGGPPGPPEGPPTGNQDPTQGKRHGRRSRPSADQAGRGKSQPNNQPAGTNLPGAPPPPGPLTPVPTGDELLMPGMEEINLEELLNDPVVIQTANRILANPDIQRLLTEIMLTMLEAPLIMPPANFLEIMEQQAREEEGQQPGQLGLGPSIGGPPPGLGGPGSTDQPQNQADQSPGLPIGARFIFITTSNLDPDFEPMPPTGGLGPLPPGATQSPDGPPRPDPQQRTVEDIMRRIQIESGHGLMSNPEQQAAEAARQRNMLGTTSSGSISTNRRPGNQLPEPGISGSRPAIGPPPAGSGTTLVPPSQGSTETKDKDKKKAPPETVHAAPAVVDDDFSGTSSPRQSAQPAAKPPAADKKQDEGQKKKPEQKDQDKKPSKRPSKDQH